MNRGVKLNKDIWNQFIHYLEKEHTKVEVIADIGDVSASSLRNWAKDKCSPKLNTLNLFVKKTCKYLDTKTKEQLFLDIMKSFRVKEKSKEWDDYRKISN